MNNHQNAVRGEWEQLRDEYFGERPIIIVANRAPVTFNQTSEGEFEFSRGAGGLVTALSALAQYLPATWIACARTEADVAWGQGRVPLANGYEIEVRFINPSAEAYDGYYNQIANPLLWFVQHSMWDLPLAPTIRKRTWDAWEDGYQQVNRQFADAIVALCRQAEKPPLVMLQDYHLYLAGRYVREQLPGKQAPTLMHFTHIPWPGPAYWRILPPTMRQAILDGMLAMDVLGFQTREDGLDFMRTVHSFLPRSSTRYKRGRVWYRNRATHVRDFPISIDVAGLRETAESEQVAAYRQEIEHTQKGCGLVVRVDRIDPSKNILRGFLAFEELLEFHPEHLGKVQFLAILIPSRLEVPEYANYLDEIMAAVGRINARFGDGDWEPVRLMINENYPRAVAAMQCYDVLLVNSIADGMNLVAKEGPVINQRHGMLILSERTGARQQLEPGALVIAPCDVFATAEAIHQALTMRADQKEEKANRLRWLIEREDISTWLLDQLKIIKELNL